MGADVHLAADFYATARGAVAVRILRARLTALWPDLSGQSLLGLGFAAPYLRLWREQARRCIVMSPAQAGAARWPPAAPSLSCTAEEDALPFPDLCFDRILLIHGIEGAENARRMLRETWRVLKDDGAVLVVAPNRLGMWAHFESTPFGQGQPYSAGQIGRLLAETLFRVERRETALYMPPTRLRLLLRAAPLFERTGRVLLPSFAGVTITEAVKDVYAAMPVQAAAKRRLIMAEAA